MPSGLLVLGTILSLRERIQDPVPTLPIFSEKPYEIKENLVGGGRGGRGRGALLGSVTALITSKRVHVHATY